MTAIDRLIEGHFADELDVEQEAELRAALRASEEHRAAYDRRAELLRTLAAKEPTAREQAVLWSRLEDALDAPASTAATTDASTATASRATASRTPRRGWLQWLPAAVAIALVVGMVYFALQGPPTPDRTIKGGATGGPLVDATVGFEIYAIRARSGGAFAAPRLVPPAGTLTLRDLIQFRYRSESDRFRHLYLGALPASGASAIGERARLYYPRPNSETSIAITRSSAPRAVARSIRLGKNHRAGRLELVAIFCQTPQPRARVLAALQALPRAEATDALSGACALRRQSYTIAKTPTEQTPR